jgi:hypothetical protein
VWLKLAQRLEAVGVAFQDDIDDISLEKAEVVSQARVNLPCKYLTLLRLQNRRHERIEHCSCLIAAWPRVAAAD